MTTKLPHLLLIPGLLCNARLWESQTQSLADISCINIPDLTEHESIPDMAEDILHRAPEQFALAGFSMGGCVALEIIARASTRVSRLALLSTNAAGLLPPVRQHLMQAIAGIEAGGLATYLAAAFPLYVAVHNADDQALWAVFSDMAEDLGPAVGIRQMRALLNYSGFRGDLADIACPTTLICGREDHRTPVSAHVAMSEHIRQAKVAVVEHAGHFTPLEEPDEVGALLREWIRAPLKAVAG
jgi:pimeloyl-ACP methyl ester carboxylesterase